MRCLLVTNVFPPQIGGPATFMAHTAQALAARGHHVTVVCSSEHPAHESDRERPYRVRRIHAASAYRYHLRVRRVLAAELLTHRTVLVNGLEPFVFPIARVLGRSCLLKVVGDTVWETARNSGRTCLDIDDFQSDPLAQNEFRALIQARHDWVLRARRVLTPSAYLRNMVIGWGVPPDRVMTIPNGVVPRVPERAPIVRDDTVPLEVLFVGRLTNWKGIETLLLAVRELEHVRATIVGDGPELPHLAELSGQLALGGRATFLGRLSRTQTDECMARAHVLVLTSLYEGLSHTLLEAMAHGVPCIASNRGGNSEVITSGRDGLLIAPQDVHALQQAIRQMRDDERGRRRMAAAAIQTTGRFPLDSTMNAFLDQLMRKES